MSTDFFKRLVNHAQQDNVVIFDADKARYIARHSEDDALLMSEARVSVLVMGRRARVIQLLHRDEIYFCLFGFSEPEVLPAGLQGADMTPGLFLCSILLGEIMPSATGADIKDAIELDYIGVDGYTGHPLEAVEGLFPKAHVYRGQKNYDYHLSSPRVVGALMARTYVDGPIYLEADTIVSLAEFFEGGSAYIPYNNFLRGLTAISWENLFLESYRSLEQIYACPKVGDLRSAWGSTKSLRELASILEDHLAWRPKEDDALAAILQVCNPHTIRECCALFKLPLRKMVAVEGRMIEQDREDSQLAKSVAKAIYSLRNQIVHYRPIHEAVVKEEVEWNEIFRLMLKLVIEAYDRFGQLFFDEVTISA